MCERINGLRNKFTKWKEAFEMSEDLKVNPGKTEVMITCIITKDGLSKSKVDPYVGSAA